jgi:hypothetical protein
MCRPAVLAIFTATLWFFLNDTSAPRVPSGHSSLAWGLQHFETRPGSFLRIAQAHAEPREPTRRAQNTRPHLRINPVYPYRRSHALYPLPYNVAYPGPRGVRHCVNRYVTERRASGAVVVPQTRCWWTRG